jgi:nucleoside-diphosphate-sugar epimerase
VARLEAVSRVLVTGGSGFVGRPLVERLAARGHEVHVVSSRAAPEAPGPASWHRADLLTPEGAIGVLDRVRPTHLVHLAWVTTPGAYWYSTENVAWVEASLRLARAFLERDGERLVGAGSCAEYEWNDGTLSEDRTPLRPRSLYGAAKNTVRELWEAAAAVTGAQVAWPRLFFLYGPGEHPERLVPSVARLVLAGEPAPCTTGVQRRDFAFVDDTAAVLAALVDGHVTGPVNVGSGVSLPVRELAEAVAREAGRPDLLRLGAIQAPAGEPEELTADVRRLREAVGFVPSTTVCDGVRRTVEWWRAQSAPAAAR